MAEFPQVRNGAFFLPLNPPLDCDEEVLVEVYIANVPGMFSLPGKVLGKGSAENPGNTIELSPEATPVLEKLERHAARHPLYREKLNLPEPTEITGPRPVVTGPGPTATPPPGANSSGPRAAVTPPNGATTPRPRPAPPPPPPGPPPKPPAPRRQKTKLDWLREVVGDEDRVIGPDVEPEAPPPAPPERKELTPSERERVKPVGEFIMDLAKAMLRSGYYSADHPGSQQAKTGLYDSLIRAIGNKSELMLVNQETREKTDVLISGILDEPVTVRTVVGQGMAEMFVPRLRDFFDRKALVSFALKRSITPPHFEAFVDIMSDPKVDRAGKEGGELLTRSLAEAGITEISTVFMDDLILFQEKLPWRVEMTINRLAKDLKVLPMYKGVSKDDLRALRLHIIEDIVRPLAYPELLRDIVVNCHVIATAVSGLDAAELEKTIIGVIPARLLLSTSRFIFQELARLRDALAKKPGEAVLIRHQANVKRALKQVASRLIEQDLPGAEKFLEDLFNEQILNFGELPPGVQHRVNTVRLVHDLRENLGEYEQAFRLARNQDDSLVLLRSFKRAMPGLFAESDWDTVIKLIEIVERAGTMSAGLKTGNIPPSPIGIIFSDLAGPLTAALDKTPKEKQARAAEAVARLGQTGLDILFKAMLESKDRGVRKMAVDGLIKAGDRALPRVRQLLDQSSQPWFVHRNALLILSFIGQGGEDQERARKFTGNREARLREEAVLAATKLTGNGAESIILAALNDSNIKVRRRAITCLSLISPVSKNTVKLLLEQLAAPVPKGKDEARVHEQKTSTYARALGQVVGLKDGESIEQALIAAAKDRLAKRTGLLSRIRSKMEDEEEPWALMGIAEALGRIGGHSALLFLHSIPEGDDELSKRAREAEEAIRARGMK